MTRRTDRLVLILIVGILYISFANGQARDPAAVKSDTTSNGVVGEVLLWVNPITKLLLEYVNAMLIRNRGVKLPCTLYNPTKWDWECTPVQK
ncbi:uncharacterized protein [Fopius arisanus]|uniref:Uncharacterized protein n=1 Tax=Fopius arisanus TaxID=64838 RepID=A0A9R1TZ22_9HYME|nr:PREDICTED: uncharacterized protein LOC105265482 [Fopius arisanus]